MPSPIQGTPGNDFISGSDGDDFIIGHEGDDQLRGQNGNDTLIGGEGNDTLAGDVGDDLLVGGDGNDVVVSIGGNDTLIGGEGNDSLGLFAATAFEHIVVSGGDGVDSMNFIGNGNAAATINLEEGTVATSFQGAPATISLQSIENFKATLSGNVLLTGSSADNKLETGNGNDTLIGGEGRDTLYGSSSDDLYVLNAAPGEANADFILFEKFNLERDGFVENDRLALDSHVMDQLGAAGDFAADDGRFYAAAGATAGAEADDRVVYDTDSGRLYYDADGSGAGEAQLIATLSFQDRAADLVAADITVI